MGKHDAVTHLNCVGQASWLVWRRTRGNMAGTTGRRRRTGTPAPAPNKPAPCKDRPGGLSYNNS